MSSKWNTVIFLKTQKDWTDTDIICQWPEVEEIRSTAGDWDWWIKLKREHSTTDKTEEIVSKLRSQDWVSNTKSSWWREVYHA